MQDRLAAVEQHFQVHDRQRQSAFGGYLAREGVGLLDYATWCALVEVHGPEWMTWPEELRNPATQAVADERERLATRVEFHAWLQWLLDTQLAAAAREIPIVNDLPIGIDIAGADAWCWQELMAADVSVGAPPDEFSQDGQDWGLTPFVPHKLRAAGYRPFIETIRGLGYKYERPRS